jgi:hypothetical protein
MSAATIKRGAAPATKTKVAIPSPVERPARMRQNKLPVGTMYGNRACTGWPFDQDRYAVQTRSPQITKQLRRRKGAVLFADALVGDYMQIWLLPCRSESKGRKIIDQLLQCGFEGSDGQISTQILQRETAFAPQNYPRGHSEEMPPRNARRIEPDWTWIEESKPEAVGTEFCIAFARSDGNWAVQINDPRLIPCFSKRARTRRSGYSVGGWGRLKQYTFPCSGRAKARKVVLKALKTLPDYEANKHLLGGVR